MFASHNFLRFTTKIVARKLLQIWAVRFAFICSFAYFPYTFSPNAEGARTHTHDREWKTMKPMKDLNKCRCQASWFNAIWQVNFSFSHSHSHLNSSYSDSNSIPCSSTSPLCHCIHLLFSVHSIATTKLIYLNPFSKFYDKLHYVRIIYNYGILDPVGWVEWVGEEARHGGEVAFA